jgi:hypothetical protein
MLSVTVRINNGRNLDKISANLRNSSGSRRNADTESPFVAGTISVYYWTVPFLAKSFTDKILSFNENF